MTALIRRGLAPLAALLMAIGLLTVSAPAGAATTTPASTTIMLYGDSITMGTAGHYTWRYRLWQGLKAAGDNVDFVGPLHTVFTYPAFGLNSMEYRAPDFDTAHAAVAGMTLTYPYQTISNLAGAYRPNVIVGLIGANDLIKKYATPDQLIATWRTQITAARAADPGVSIILGEYGETWISGMTTYNQDLTALAAEMDTPTSRVIATAVPQLNYWNDTLDGVHLTTSGEKIQAATVADALAQLGLPSAAAPSDPAPVPGQFAPTLSATATVNGVELSWTAVDYASSEDVLAQDVASGLYAVKKFVTGTSANVGGIPGHTYRIWLFPVQGWALLGTLSKPVIVTVPTS